MAQLLVMLKDALSFTNKKTIVIDSWEFKTSSQFTPALLVLGSMMVTTRQFFGEPIKCDSGSVRFPNFEMYLLVFKV